MPLLGPRPARLYSSAHGDNAGRRGRCGVGSAVRGSPVPVWGPCRGRRGDSSPARQAHGRPSLGAQQLSEERGLRRKGWEKEGGKTQEREMQREGLLGWEAHPGAHVSSRPSLTDGAAKARSAETAFPRLLGCGTPGGAVTRLPGSSGRWRDVQETPMKPPEPGSDMRAVKTLRKP